MIELLIKIISSPGFGEVCTLLLAMIIRWLEKRKIKAKTEAEKTRLNSQIEDLKRRLNGRG